MTHSFQSPYYPFPPSIEALARAFERGERFAVSVTLGDDARPATEIRWKLTSAPRYGLPDAFEADVLRQLHRMTQMQDEPTVSFRLSELLRSLSLQETQPAFSATLEALRLLVAINLDSSPYWDPTDEALKEFGCHIFVSLDVRRRTLAETSDGSETILLTWGNSLYQRIARNVA